MTERCPTCKTPTEGWMHLCTALVHVTDPGKFTEDWLTSNPLDRLSLEEYIEIVGDDAEEAREQAAAAIEQNNRQYFGGPLHYRVELRPVAALGFQGAIVSWALAVRGRELDDAVEALEFINSKPNPLVFLNTAEIYSFDLVSTNDEGIRYVWMSKKMQHDVRWRLSDWNHSSETTSPDSSTVDIEEESDD